MKDLKNRLKVKRLFILGAGASYSASKVVKPDAKNVAPLDKDFCRRIVSLTTKKPYWVAEAIKKVKSNWKDHRAFENFGLEYAIIRQLSHLEFINAIQPKRRTDYTEQEFLNLIGHLITFILTRTRESKFEPYKKLAANVFPPSVNIGKSFDRIITFNYDDLLDQHLITRFEVERLYFDRIKESSNQFSPYRTNRFSDPLMIKLHGSINWRCSTKEFMKIIDHTKHSSKLFRIDPIWYSSTSSPSPDDNESPCIIPPIPAKPITKISLFAYLWTKASEYLSMAEELVICGYSLPDTDPLAFSLFTSIKNSRLKRVIVVDPEPEILKKWRALLVRKGVSKAEWTYHSDFVEFVERLK